jgi:MYXO-CTERM domain-containing protein
VSTLTGGCTTKCGTPQGGLFCDDQYIDVAAITDCSFSLDVTTTTTSPGTISTSCAAAPGGGSGFSFPAGIVAIAGLGLFAARRRRM